MKKIKVVLKHPPKPHVSENFNMVFALICGVVLISFACFMSFSMGSVDEESDKAQYKVQMDARDQMINSYRFVVGTSDSQCSEDWVSTPVKVTCQPASVGYRFSVSEHEF